MRIIGILLLALLWGCDEKSYRYDNSTYLIENLDKNVGSTTAGNLVATAIQEVHGLDVVFYPSDFLREDGIGLLTANASLNLILSMYPEEGAYDQFMIGTMSGQAIKDFIRSRVAISYSADLQVAGIEYFASFTGGQGDVSFRRKYGPDLVADQYYRVAISNFFYFSSATFPSYQYGNNLDYDFKQAVAPLISAKEAVAEYVARHADGFPELSESRALVINHVIGDAGRLPIYQIQGESHRSPYIGNKVITTGVVTAIGSSAWYPGGIDLYIQDPVGDGNPLTSDGIHIHLDQDITDLRMADLVEVSGVIYEQMTGSGLSRTSIREVSNIRALANAQPLPEAIGLGSLGISLPDEVISSYNGDLNFKKRLNLNDGLDLYESLEGMRVKLMNPRITGFRGGKEELEGRKAKGYLTLYVLPDGDQNYPDDTAAGGLMSRPGEEDYNPELIMITTNHLTKGIDTSTIFNIGDVITGELTGVMSYEKNIFGDGEYTLVLPEDQNLKGKLTSKSGSSSIVPVASRPKTSLVSDESQLTIATFNVENLAGNQYTRLKLIGGAITTNLKCPDILNLVEIQDLNGAMYTGAASADETLRRLINEMDCGEEMLYKWVNIDPVNHSEGGEPGGNIRVVQLYNANKLTFVPRGSSAPLEKALVMEDGSLNNNPGRIFPNDEAFAHSRKSLVVEYQFHGKKIFVLGNHFKSKLGDSSHWGNVQPVTYGSEAARAAMASKVKEFIHMIEYYNPQALIAVMGDFNAYPNESSIQILKAAGLYNMLELLPPNDRYTHNYNGSSQALDYIFANGNLLDRNGEINILHINTDFMGRLSDHDPVVARFQF